MICEWVHQESLEHAHSPVLSRFDKAGLPWFLIAQPIVHMNISNFCYTCQHYGHFHYLQIRNQSSDITYHLLGPGRREDTKMTGKTYTTKPACLYGYRLLGLQLSCYRIFSFYKKTISLLIKPDISMNTWKRNTILKHGENTQKINKHSKIRPKNIKLASWWLQSRLFYLNRVMDAMDLPLKWDNVDKWYARKSI